MTPAEEVGELAAQLHPLLVELRGLLAEPVADPTTGSTQHHKVTGSPEPWHKEAAGILFDIHAGVRELEQLLIYVVTGQLRDRRPGSDGNTNAAITAITRQVHGVPERIAQSVRDAMAGWIEQARQVRDIDQSERWIPIHVPAGGLPPACPYCETYGLRMALESGRATCVNPMCRDSLGHQPRGWADRDRLSGDSLIAWADGRRTYYGEDRT